MSLRKSPRLTPQLLAADSQCEEFTNPPISPPGPGDVTRMKKIMEAADSNISPSNPQSVEALENLKINYAMRESY